MLHLALKTWSTWAVNRHEVALGSQQVNNIAYTENSVSMRHTKKFSPGTPHLLSLFFFLPRSKRCIIPIPHLERDYSKAPEYVKSPMRHESAMEFQFPDWNEHRNHLNANACFLKHLLFCIV